MASFMIGDNDTFDDIWYRLTAWGDSGGWNHAKGIAY